jgi:hypothetical protein
MILGMSPALFVHVVLSLIGLVAGFIVLAALFRGEHRAGWAALFLLTTALTSVTGFLLPADRFLPSHWVGVISLVVLAAAIAALYLFRLGGAWRAIYAATAIAALYFNFFVFVVQLFRKIPALHALAPTESEAPFAVTQLVVLVVFVVAGIVATRAFRRGAAVPA